MNSVEWLPDLVLPHGFSDEQTYVQWVYHIYLELYVSTKPIYNHITVQVKRVPYRAGFDSAFFHLTTSQGSHDSEEAREPDIERCKRIRWPRAIIEHASQDEVWVWENTRKGKVRTLLWIKRENYLVVLENRDQYYLLWTAYLTDREHTRKKLEKEYSQYKAKTAF